MSESTTLNRISNMDMPEYYSKYYIDIAKQSYKMFEVAADAKATLRDSSSIVEPKIAFDLSDRVAKMHDIDIADHLRELLTSHSKEESALLLSKEIAEGKFLPIDATKEEKADLAVRVGLAVVTEGVTIAPLQGISDIKIKKNKDSSEYLSVYIAGPMRSAGGTESAVTMLIADHVRKILGLSKYQANCFDDETGRFIEELRIYEREASSFQYHVEDDDITTVITNLPVELNGVDTNPYEVVNHKNMTRISTDRVRGGALRVLNDGLIGRSKKLTKRVEHYKMEGWEWLKDLHGAVQKDSDDEDAGEKRMHDLIAGRSILSIPKKLGGFRLRYGRSCNTGFASMGLHPAVAEILDHTIVVGTQIKTNIPGKGATVAFVDSIETPIVKLKNGDVIKIQDVKEAIKVKNNIAKILHLGDILISYGDFVENNAQLIPSGYVEEYWQEELREKIKDSKYGKFLTDIPTLDESLQLSKELQIPLHPKYTYYWNHISQKELQLLITPVNPTRDLITYTMECKTTLETLGVPHTIQDGMIILKSNEARIFHKLLLDNPLVNNDESILQIISNSSGITIREKFSTSVGVRVGRPEKAAAREMDPPTHILFPVGDKGTNTQDLTKAAAIPDFFTSISNRICPKCNELSIELRCRNCDEKTISNYICPSCHTELTESECKRCKRKALQYSFKPFPLKKKLLKAQERTGIRVQSPFKGVNELVNTNRIAEPLEKGLIRQNLNLTMFKDGTIRYEATNSPLTHFKPRWIGTSLDKLHQLGYTKDINGDPLQNLDQTVEILMQDVIIPLSCATYLVATTKYIDRELKLLYEKKPFYNVNNTDSLLGQFIIGLAPHTSVGIVGRIIGYTNTHVCFATPNWHSAKRRDADGDADSIMLLLDPLLNFSRHFLSDRIGGLMDIPLLVQPIVMPHESQSQAHNFEVMRRFPLEFFQKTREKIKASDITCVDVIKSRLDTSKQFSDYYFTHTTLDLVTSRSRSAYSTLDSMMDKFDMQVKNAELINVVDPSETVSDVISTHFVPDIMGNLRSYTRQKVRCTKCGESYRRIPLTKKCKCKHILIQTITRPSIEKYLKLAKRLVEKYDVGEYQKSRIHALADEIELVFGKSKGEQSYLSDFSAT